MKPTTIAGLGAAALLGAAGAAAAWFVRRPWPQTNGSVALDGLRGPAEIIRDAWGVPHIYADDEHDLFFAQGYAHAQDRLWQMEFNRRVGRGTLSAVLGAATLPNDRFLRTIGLYRLARREWETLPPDSRAVLESYAAGVNAFIGANRRRLPVEFTLLRVAPEPWTPLDSLAWGKGMAWILSDNYDAELLRARLVATVGAEAAQALLPPYRDGAALHLPREADGYRWIDGQPSADLDVIAAMQGGPLSNQGSNGWAVHGSRTGTGKPLLANDTHLYLHMPSLWYENGLHGGRFDCAGSTMPGVPMIILGHNCQIAWGISDMLPDVEDFYIERLDDPADPRRYEHRGEWLPLEQIEEQIEVKGQEPVALTVRQTVHGPLMNGVLDDMQDRAPLALRWAAHTRPGLFAALTRLNLAQSWDEFRQALGLWDSPCLNVVYADVAGNIGFQSAGAIPTRVPEHQGLLPVPGWTGAYEWQGWVPFDELPSSFNPPSGFVVNANNNVAPPGYPHQLAHEWGDPYRVRRISDWLAARAALDLDDMRALQSDIYSLPAAALRPYLLAVEPAGPREARALELLRAWDLCCTADQAAPAIYNVWYSCLLRSLFGPRLGEQLLESYQHYYWLHMPMVIDLLARPDSAPWFADPALAPAAARDQAVRRAFADALAWLSGQLGPDPDAWRWGRLHTLTLVHRPFGQSGIKPLMRLFNSPTLAAPGDDFTVNAAWTRDSAAFRMTGGAAQRLIVDTADFDRSLTIHAGGQSAHLFHPHRSDLLEPWRDGDYHPLLFSRAAVLAHARATLRLKPAGP